MVATITLESTNGDSVTVSGAPSKWAAANWIDDDIVLDVDPQGMYDTAFTLRTQSGAFETGGRIVGVEVPIREPILPFWLTPESRRRFQKLWGTPGNFHKVKAIWDVGEPSGPRWLWLRLAKEIVYTTDDGFDSDIDEMIHAVVSTVAINPMYESPEEVQEWTNPGAFTVEITASGGTYPLSFGGETTDMYSVDITATGGTFPLTYNLKTTTQIPHDAEPEVVQAKLEALSTVGEGNVKVIGTPGHYLMAFTTSGASSLSSSTTNLTGAGKAVDLTVGIPHDADAEIVQMALEALPSVGPGNVTVTGTPDLFLVTFEKDTGLTGVLSGSTAGLTGLFKSIKVENALSTGWFEVWNPTDQPLNFDWTFDPAEEWQFPDFGFGQERKWGRPVGADAARMIVTPELTQLLSVMVDPMMDTYVNADLSNASGLFAGVEPLYPVPPYTGTEDDPVLMPVVCKGPAGAKVTLRQRRFWSAESGLE